MFPARTRRLFNTALGIATLALLGLGAWRLEAVLARRAHPKRYTLYVLFKDVQGLRAGSRVMLRGTPVGRVAGIELEPGGRRVRVRLDLDPAVAPLCTTRLECWVVRPRFAGLAGGLSGLDTLVKEGYLRLGPRDGGELLPQGAEIAGLEAPPRRRAAEELEDPGIGDLLCTVVLPEAHGLKPGSPVVHRGIRTGEVRAVELAPGGGAVLVRCRIARDYRRSVTDTVKWWVQRPIASGGLIGGLRIEHLESVIEPALAYGRAPRRGEPAADGAVFTAVSEPPPGAPAVRLPAGWRPGPGPGAAAAPLRARLEPRARLRYHAVEVDLFSSDDELAYEGPAVLFTRHGALYALARRSDCDGAFRESGGLFDRIDVRDERIRVELSDGRILPAVRTWTAPDGADLCLLRLRLPEAPRGLPAPDTYLDFSPAAAEDGTARVEDGLVVRSGRVAGFAARTRGSARVRERVGFHLVPVRFRPAPAPGGGGSRERRR